MAMLPSVAVAHPGANHFGHDHSFISGFLHPVLGLDHLVAMTAVGLWAAYVGGRALVIVPLAFVGMAIVGAVLGRNGVQVPAAEQTIAASLVLFGLMIGTLVRLPAATAAVIVSLFAMFHGYAHGAEIPDVARPLSYGAGFVLGTIVLVGFGVAIGHVGRSVPTPVIRAVGVAIAVFGIVTVAGSL